MYGAGSSTWSATSATPRGSPAPRVMPAESPGPDGKVSSNIVRAPTSPDQLLRAYWFADLIHWGDQRKALAALQRHPFETAWSDLYARECAVELGHLYIGFAVLVSNALG
jgi:hypothetical protein